MVTGKDEKEEEMASLIIYHCKLKIACSLFLNERDQIEGGKSKAPALAYQLPSVCTMDGIFALIA